jgi:hypothetical protein|eukprot:COSAG02_NODE_1416_length_12734_cov_9.649545_5_plen_170_part_00
MPAEDVAEHAEYLGFDLSSNPELLWLAEEACDAPLPADWASHTDAEGELFYYSTTGNGADSTSTYDHPLDGHFKTLYSILSSERSANTELPAAALDRRHTPTIYEESEEQQQARPVDESADVETDSGDDGSDMAAFSTPSKLLERSSSDGDDPVPEEDVVIAHDRDHVT